MSDKLTVSEALDLQKHEKTIQQDKDAFVRVGMALTDIRDRRLYRKDYDTFQVYCQEKWGFHKQHAHRLIAAAEIVNDLNKESSMGDKIPTERAARALAKVPKKKRAAVVKKIVEGGEAVTEKAVKKAAVEVVSQGVAKDSVGRTIPNKILGYWCRMSEVKEHLSSIGKIITVLKKSVEDKDLMYAEVSNSAISDLDKAYHTIQCAVPYAVCPICQGHPDAQPQGECRLCKGRGLISKFLWERAVPEETKKMIEGQVKK